MTPSPPQSFRQTFDLAPQDPERVVSVTAKDASHHAIAVCLGDCNLSEHALALLQ